MTDFVRVRDSRTGHEYTVTSAALARSRAYLTELDEPAVDGRGRALPATNGTPKPQPVAVTEPKTSTKSKES